jgi:acyl dehydratase
VASPVQVAAGRFGCHVGITDALLRGPHSWRRAVGHRGSSGQEGHDRVRRPIRPMAYPVDEEAARQGPFGGLTASSGYSIGLLYSSANRGIWNHPDSPVPVIAGIDMRLRYPNPLRPGDRVRSSLVIAGKRLSSTPGRGIVEGTLELVNQDGHIIIAGEMVWLIATRP